MLIVRTSKYTVEEMVHITAIRATVENVEIEQDALTLLGDIGARTSLRYSVQMLTPARILAQTAGRTKITVEDVKQVDQLFVDGKASSQLLANSEGFLQ
jgi:RuvB-like protein 1 (pontin 52)